MARNVGGTLLLAGIVMAGSWAYDKIFGEKNKKKIEERKQKEIKLWNNGKCPKCGGKWYARKFYPSGSRGAYQYVAIACHKCKTKSTLQVYTPEGIEYEYVDVDKI